MFNLKQYFMQKKNLFASAILMLCTLFVFTGCKEVMSSLDNPVSAYLKVDPASAKIYRGQSYKIPYSTISDAKPIFTTADDKVATVDENGVVTGVMMGTTKITIEVPATDNYQAASAEFTVEVDGLLKMPLLEKEMALNEEYNLGVTSVSTGAITYTSSDVNVATVDADGNVKAIACGDATITVHIEATPEYDRTEDLEFKAKVRIFDFATLKSYCAASEEPYVILGDNAVINLTSELNLTNKTKVEIAGSKEYPATIVVTDKSITIDKGLKLSNVIVDGTGQTATFVKGYKQSSGQTYDPVASGQWVVTDPVVFEGITAKGLQKAFYDCNSTAYVYVNFTINDCNIAYGTTSNVPLNFASAMAINFNITNSTFSATSMSANFIALSGKRPWQVTGYESETGKLIVDHCTFYNIAKSKQFLNTNTLKGQIYKYEMNSNIFVDTSNKKIYGNMTNNQNQVTTDSKNTYIFDGTFFAETNYNGDAGLQSDPSFKDAANGDFTPQGAEQIANKTGDPRWLK